MPELLTLWKRAVADKTGLIERVFALLDENQVRYCVVGGVAVNAYAEPVFTADLHIAVAVEDLPRLRALLESQFRVREFAHSLNVSEPGSKLQVQFQKDAPYPEFVGRAERREVLDLVLPVATAEDLLRGKVLAAQDTARRRSKRLKDLADIARLLEAFPDLQDAVPDTLRRQLEI